MDAKKKILLPFSRRNFLLVLVITLSFFVLSEKTSANDQLPLKSVQSEIVSNTNVSANDRRQLASAPHEIPSTKQNNKSDKINIFTDYKQRVQYESAQLNYELWRLDFNKKIHEYQKSETERYSTLLFCSIIGAEILLIVSLIISYCNRTSQNKDENTVKVGYGQFYILLTINGILFVTVLFLFGMFYLYLTQMYQIN